MSTIDVSFGQQASTNRHHHLVKLAPCATNSAGSCLDIMSINQYRMACSITIAAYPNHDQSPIFARLSPHITSRIIASNRISNHIAMTTYAPTSNCKETRAVCSRLSAPMPRVQNLSVRPQTAQFGTCGPRFGTRSTLALP